MLQQLFGKALQARMGSIDCVDKVCYWTYELVESCVVFQKGTNDSKCQIPCNLESCSFDIVNGIECQLWTCEFYPTPSPIITTTTQTPEPPPNENFITQILLFLLAFFSISIFIFALLKKCRIIELSRGLATQLTTFAFRRGENLAEETENSSLHADNPATQNQDDQPQRDFFSIALENDDIDETENLDIAFLNATPPGQPSTWHSHSVASRFTKTVQEIFQNFPINPVQRFEYQRLN